MVVSMKMMTLSGPMADFDAVVHQVVQHQEFQPEPAMNLMRDIRGIAPFPVKNPYAPLLTQAGELLRRLDLQADAPYDGVALSAQEAQAQLEELETQLRELEQQMETAKNDLENAAHLSEQLTGLTGISARLEDLRGMRFARFRFGHMPRESYNSIKNALEAREDVFFVPTKSTSELVFGVYFTTVANHDSVDSLFNSLHFIRLMIDEQAQGSPEEALERLEQRKAAAFASLEAAQQSVETIRTQSGESLGVMFARLKQQNDTYDLRRFAAHSHDNFYLTGWVPEPALEDTLARLKRFPHVSVVQDDAEDIAQVATPPTKLKNNFFGRIFEPFVAMFGLPKYGESDPSFFMAATYTLFFGLMFGDLGQGLCMALIGFLLAKRKKMWLGNIITCCGLSAAVFGCLYGSVFGFEDVLPGFKVMEGNNIMLTLVMALGLGVITILVVIAKNIIAGFREKDWKRALFGANGLAGMIFYLSAVLMVANIFLQTGLPIGSPLYIVLLVLVPLICVLFAEPLANLLSGKRPIFHESIGSFLAVGFFELFETALSFLTNTLSFLRVGAYAIIHAGMMHVVFLPLHAGVGPVSIFVLIFGNVFVMGFEGLLVGIQVLRLEFYEMFGRFYSAGGRAYTGSKI